MRTQAYRPARNAPASAGNPAAMTHRLGQDREDTVGKYNDVYSARSDR